jgi:hypothetical protein
VAPAGGELYVELLALFAALVPLGLLFLRGLERYRGRPFSLAPFERVLVAFYVAGALLFALASLPVALFGGWLVAGVLSAGAVGIVGVWIRERGRSVLAFARWFGTPAALLVVAIALLLLALEVGATGGRSYPNVYDGGFQSLFLQQLLTQHSVAWTLSPYADSGVIYPQATTVWFSVPILLFAWPIPSAPVGLPLLFFALAVPAAFCWGARLAGPDRRRGDSWGLLFAGAFGALLSMPRFFIGGSYDFVLGLPLFVLALGWILPFLEQDLRSWRDVVLFGALLGVLTSLSLALGEALVLLVVAFVLAARARTGLGWTSVLSRLGLILALACVVVVRSIVGVVVWYSYPAHVLSATGSPPYVSIAGLPSPTPATFVGALDPFVPLKPKLSPLPALSVEIAVLLAVGIALSALWLLRPRSRVRRWLPAGAMLPIWVGTAVMFLWTGWLILASGTGTFASVFDSLASYYESSYLLFLFYQVIALLPLLVVVECLLEGSAHRAAAPTDEEEAHRPDPPSPLRRRRSRSLPPVAIAAAVLLAVPLGIGVGVSAVQAPEYLSSHLAGLSNVTPSDVAALTWAGQVLPACSVVLVAPGSAGQFLPVFARVHLDFPMMPLSVNRSYNVSVWDLIQGVYLPNTRAAMLSLGITEVFVSGRTSVSYLPLDPTPLESSPDFSAFFHQGDAYVFGFLPEIQASGCAPA